MAQPYVQAMNHAEWHAKSVLKKLHRRRPLGDIETAHRYRPAQPVLSSRTVDIDASGTRTYRARTAADIIEEQHRIIHEIYSKARTIASAPAGGRSRPRSHVSEEAEPQSLSRGLQALRVEGSGSGAGKSQSRPTSSKTQFIVLKTRPQTTGSQRRRAQPAVDVSEFLPDVDPASSAYSAVKQQIQHHWEPEQRALDGGQLVRGRKDGPSVSATIDARSAGPGWLSFGGGRQERGSTGVVDAFTAMKHEGQFYAIDGHTGTTVARQLQRGDRIRIGVNGGDPPPDPRIKEYQENLGDGEAEGESPETRKGELLPLCWADQVDRESTIIREPSNVKPAPTVTPQAMLNLSEPVVFRKYGPSPAARAEQNAEQPQSRGPALAGGPLPKNTVGVRIVEGYGVTRRTSERTLIDGSRDRPVARVTHLSVNRRAGQPAELRDLTYEEILDMRIKAKAAGSGALVHEQVAAAERHLAGEPRSPRHSPERARLPTGSELEGGTGEVLSERRGASEGFEETRGVVNGVAEHFEPVIISEERVSKSSRKERLPRPASTVSSSGAQDFGGYIIGAPPAASGTRHVTSPAEGGRPVGRRKLGATGAARPRPLKPNLHKTAAATGQSIGSSRGSARGGANGGGTEFVALAQQICVNHTSPNAASPPPSSGDEQSESGATPRSRNTAAVRSVSEHNRPRTGTERGGGGEAERSRLGTAATHTGSVTAGVKFREEVEMIAPQQSRKPLHTPAVTAASPAPIPVPPAPTPAAPTPARTFSATSRSTVPVSTGPEFTAQDDRSVTADSVGSTEKKYAFNIPTAAHEPDTEGHERGGEGGEGAEVSER